MFLEKIKNCHLSGIYPERNTKLKKVENEAKFDPFPICLLHLFLGIFPSSNIFSSPMSTLCV